ncbi:unnamed protein product [Penicillium viridicatum]
MPKSASTSITTSSLEPTSTYQYDSILGSSTSSNTAASETGSEYPVFPNGAYISRFYVVSSQESGLTDLDIDLYNECFLPHNPLPHHNFRRDDTTETISPKPTYLINEAPCKRQAAINSIATSKIPTAHFQAFNCIRVIGTSSSNAIVTYIPSLTRQPVVRNVIENMEGLRVGLSHSMSCYHWFPESYVKGVSSAYCSANPQTTGFYPFANAWSTSSAASLPSTTAVDSLGTQTAASLYYTYAAESTAAGGSSSSEKNSAVATTRLSLKRALVAALPLVLMLSQ